MGNIGLAADPELSLMKLCRKLIGGSNFGKVVVFFRFFQNLNQSRYFSLHNFFLQCLFCTALWLRRILFSRRFSAFQTAEKRRLLQIRFLGIPGQREFHDPPVFLCITEDQQSGFSENFEGNAQNGRILNAGIGKNPV